MTDDDRKNFGLALELDPNPKSKYFGSECLVAQTVTVKDDDTGEEILYDLKPLVLDHLCQLCRNVGVCNTGSMNKFELRSSTIRTNWIGRVSVPPQQHQDSPAPSVVQ